MVATNNKNSSNNFRAANCFYQQRFCRKHAKARLDECSLYRNRLTFLTPTIAKTYGIERSRYNGLVNISVLDANLKGNPAKTVLISGTAKNNIGQSKTLDFKEVKEGSAIYYLAQLHYSNEETFHFAIKIDDGNGQKTLKFDQKFYVD